MTRSYLRKKSGFTLIELLIVIALIALLSSIVLIAMRNARIKARDTKRISDIQQLVKALALYYSDNNAYPPVSQTGGQGGWEVSYLPGYLKELSPKYAIAIPNDPTNDPDASGFSFFGPKNGSYYYAYYNYPASVAASYGCNFNSDFAVIAIRQLEGGPTASTPKAQCGVQPPGGCPEGGTPGVCRDWSTEFDYSIMLVK